MIALVAAVGTDVGMVADEVATALAAYDYESDILRFSDYLAEQADEDFRQDPFDESLWKAMDEGDKLRQKWERDDALALNAISDIVATREEKAGSVVETCPGETEPANLERHAFILRSLKTPHELETLRAVYGSRLITIGAYSPDDKRLQHLGERIQRSRQNSDRATWVHQPEALILRDRKEEEVGGQDVSGTFHRADFFVRAWSDVVAREDLARTMEILFGAPFRTPTRDEHGQFQAAGAAVRSAEFGRQVGAAVTTQDGSVIAVGTNEVPKFRGGSHWEEDGAGNRDFEVGDQDTNRKHLDELAEALTASLARAVDDVVEELGAAPPARGTLDSARDALLSRAPSALRAGGLRDLTEFGRAVHAEMNALLDAARRGVPVTDATLYTTTFPCHNCARHVIGAGITRVVFIEPYTKSRAEDLHPESLAIAQSNAAGRVAFEPFVGVAPRRYLQMFDAAARERLGHTPRKNAAGSKAPFEPTKALPVFVDVRLEQFRPELPGYRAKELLALEHFGELTTAHEQSEEVANDFASKEALAAAEQQSEDAPIKKEDANGGQERT